MLIVGGSEALLLSRWPRKEAMVRSDYGLFKECSALL